MSNMEHEFDNYDEADAYAYDDTHFSELSTDWDDLSDDDADWKQEDYEERYYEEDEDAFTSMGWGMDESYGNYNDEW